MKSLRKSIAVPRFPFAGFLILGVVLLAAGQAGAVSADEQRLFNAAEDDRWHDDVRTLLAKGVSPNVPVDVLLQRAAIHVAAERGAVKNLASMLQAGGNPNLPDGEGNTPLHWASTGGAALLTSDHPAAIRLLGQHGADLHRTNHHGSTPLHVAVTRSYEASVIKALLDLGAQPDRVDGAGLTVLQRFAKDGTNDGRIVTLLLKAGANPDHKTPGGDTPLHLAVRLGSGLPAVVQALLNGGAEPCVQDAEGYTPYQLYNAQADPTIQQALGRAQGHDLACDKKKQAEEPQQAEGGPTDGSGTGEERPGQAPAMQPFGPNWIVAENQPCQAFNPNPHPGETYTWSGGCVDGKVSGKGREVLQFPDGKQSVYEGSMRAGKFHGQGTSTWADGSRYEGQWREGEFHGQGTFTGPDGSRYEGQWREGKKHGQGTSTWANGNRYEGPWYEGKPHGYGTYTGADGDSFEGQWHNGCSQERAHAIGTSLEACGYN